MKIEKVYQENSTSFTSFVFEKNKEKYKGQFTLLADIKHGDLNKNFPFDGYELLDKNGNPINTTIDEILTSQEIKELDRAIFEVQKKERI